MELMIDIILIATTLTAIIYCYVLNKRLQSFKGSAASLGVTITSLSTTVEQARSTVILAKESSAEGVEQLTPIVTEAHALIPELNALLDVITDLADVKAAELNEISRSTLEKVDEKMKTIDLIGSPINQTLQEASSDDWFAAPEQKTQNTFNAKMSIRAA